MVGASTSGYMLGRVREGRDSPWLAPLAGRSVRRVSSGERTGLTVMRNEKSAEKLMAPADCTDWHTAGGPAAGEPGAVC